MLAVVAILAILAGTHLDCAPRLVPSEPVIVETRGASLITFNRVDLQYRCTY